MLIVHEEDIALIETPHGNAVNGVVTSRQGASEVRVIRHREEAGGFNPPHTHDREEVMLMRAGAVTVTVGNESAALRAGDLLIVPPNVVHHIENTGSQTGEWLLISPTGTRFFRPDGEEVIPSWGV